MNQETVPDRAMRKDTIQAVKVAEKEYELDLVQLAGTLWRGKWKILIYMLITISIGGYYAFIAAVPKYKASTIVVLESRDNQVVDFETVLSGLSADQATLNTETEVLQARILIGKLVDQLDLVEDPEFNNLLKPQNPWSIGGFLRAIGLRQENRTPPSERAIIDGVISDVIQQISIQNIRNSYVFQIVVETEAPEKSALIADTLAEFYINDQLTTKFEATERATAWLTDRVSELQAKLETAETAVKEYNTQTDLISPQALAALNRQLKDLRSRLIADRRAQEELGHRILTMKTARDTDDAQSMALAAGDGALNQTLNRINNGAADERRVFDARFRQVLARLQADYDRIQSQVETLATSVIEKQLKIEGQSADLVKLQQLEREAAASGLIYEYFLSRLKETSVQQGIQQADSRILSYAVVPERASHPRKGITLVLSTILGGALGAMLVLMREIRQTGFRSAGELEQETGITVIGEIPLAPRSRRKKVLDYIVSKPTSALVEAVRNLRTSILLSNIDKPPKIIMMTSSVPGEGKTTQTLALAQNLAGMGRTVLMIEGDIRRRTFQEYFDIKGRPGLLSAVSGAVELDEAIWRSEQLGVDVLVGEESNLNAADFFSSEKFGMFLETVRKTYDVVLIDTTPVLVVPDARVIAQSVDAVIYVVRWDSTPRSQVEQGLHAFETVNVPVAGLVLSQINPKGMKRYGESYSTYGAKYYNN